MIAPLVNDIHHALLRVWRAELRRLASHHAEQQVLVAAGVAAPPSLADDIHHSVLRVRRAELSAVLLPVTYTERRALTAAGVAAPPSLLVGDIHHALLLVFSAELPRLATRHAERRVLVAVRAGTSGERACGRALFLTHLFQPPTSVAGMW